MNIQAQPRLLIGPIQPLGSGKQRACRPSSWPVSPPACPTQTSSVYCVEEAKGTSRMLRSRCSHRKDVLLSIRQPVDFWEWGRLETRESKIIFKQNIRKSNKRLSDSGAILRVHTARSHAAAQSRSPSQLDTLPQMRTHQR